MLKELRDYSSSWMIKGLMIVLASTFILWGSGRISGCNEDVAAKVNGEVISMANFHVIADQQLNLYREQMRLYFKKDLTAADEESYRKIVFTNLIDEIILKQKAAELKVPISSTETKESIKELPYFQNEEGAFDYEKYINIVRSYFRKTPEAFEQEKYEDLRVSRLEWIVKNSVLLGTEDKEFETTFKKEKIKLGFIALDPTSFEDRVTVDPAKVKQFFKEHTSFFTTPTGQTPNFDSIADEVSKSYKKDEAKKYAKNTGKELLAECMNSKKIETIQKAAKKNNLTVENTDYLGRNPSGYIPKIGTDFETMKDLFMLSKENPCMNEIKEISGKHYLIWLIDKKEDAPQEENDTYFGKNYVETRKKDSFFTSYKKNLEKHATVKKYMYQDNEKT